MLIILRSCYLRNETACVIAKEVIAIFHIQQYIISLWPVYKPFSLLFLEPLTFIISLLIHLWKAKSRTRTRTQHAVQQVVATQEMRFGAIESKVTELDAHAKTARSAREIMEQELVEIRKSTGQPFGSSIERAEQLIGVIGAHIENAEAKINDQIARTDQIIVRMYQKMAGPEAQRTEMVSEISEELSRIEGAQAC